MTRLRQYLPLSLCLLLLASCSAASRDISEPDSSAGAQPGSLEQAIAQVVAAPVPAGIEPGLYERLRAELVRVLQSRGAGRLTSTPPKGSLNQIRDLRLSQHADGKWYLEWTYQNQGDNDQNSEVNISDLTPIGSWFGARAGEDNWDQAQIADADGNGEVNISDITAIGMNFLSQLDGYEVFGSLSSADHPSNNSGSNGPGTIEIAKISFDDAIKGLSAAKLVSVSPYRKRFQLEVVMSAQNPYYWVRPYDSGDTLGESSLLGGGDPAQRPLLAVSDPPAVGTGSLSDPYVPERNWDYVFSLTDPLDGDVSTSPETQYLVSDPYAGVISNTNSILRIPATYSGSFLVQGYYKGIPCTAESIVYCQLGAPPAGLTLSLTNPPGLGDGSSGNPYIADVSTDYVFLLMHSADGDVSTDPTSVYTVSGGAGTIASGSATLNIEDGFSGDFSVSASYNGLAAAQTLYFRVAGEYPITITLTNPPPAGSGSLADPYIVDTQTDYVFSAVHDTEGDVTSRVFFYDDPDGFYRRPGSEEYRIDMWNCRYGDFAVYAQGSYDLGYVYSNGLYFRLPVIGFSDASFTEYVVEYPPGTSQSADEIVWFSATEGYVLHADGGQWECWSDLYHTTDGGQSWLRINRIDGQNTGINAALFVSLFMDEMWFGSFFSGFGISGSAGYSTNGGVDWIGAGVPIQSSWDDNPLDEIIPSYPIGPFTRTGSDLWVTGGDYYGYIAHRPLSGGDWSGLRLSDSGLSWLSALGTPSYLLLRAERDTPGNKVFYRWNGTDFVEWTANIPADATKNDLNWSAAPGQDYIALTDLWWNEGNERVLGTGDGGASFDTLYRSGDIPCEDAPGAPNFDVIFALALDPQTCYVSGVFYETDYEAHMEVYLTTDGGGSWQLIYSNYDTAWVIVPHADYDGGVHMDRCWLYQDRYPVYTGGHYIGVP